MALPQRKEPDDERREYDEAENQRVADTKNDGDDAVVRRNDVVVHRRHARWGWLWFIVIALFIWWAVWGMGHSGGWFHGRHGPTLGPGTNHNPAITAPNSGQPNNGQPTNGPNAPYSPPTPNNNAPAAPPQP